MYRVPDPKTDYLIVTSAGRAVDIRQVDPMRLMTVTECDEVLHAIRCRIQRITARLNTHDLDPDQRIRARDALQFAEANREKVQGRIRFLLEKGDQQVELAGNAAAFVAVARRRLGREVFAELMREATGR